MSYSTELAQEFPAHVEAAWIGRSVPIAKKHYWQVTEDHSSTVVGETKTVYAGRGRRSTDHG